MTSPIDIGKDGQSVIWQKHLLTPVMQSLGCSDLLLEPILNPSGARAFVTENTATSIKWKWNPIKRVEVFAPGNNKVFYPDQTPEIRWNDLASQEDFEIVFLGDNATLACVRCEIPELAHFGRHVEFGEYRSGVVSIRLRDLNPEDAITVELLGFGHEGRYRRKAEPARFSKGQGHLSIQIPLSFHGLIVVIKTRRQRSLIVGYAEFAWEQKSVRPQTPREGMNETEFLKLRRWNNELTGNNIAAPNIVDDWLNNWPNQTQKRFRQICELARRHLPEAEVLSALTGSLPGLFRYLTLASCGYKAAAARQVIAKLNGQTFEAALHIWRPELMNTLNRLASPQEQAWAVSNGDNPDLPAAAATAQEQGRPALNRVLHLLNRRREAIAAWEVRSRTRANAAASI